MKSLLYPSLLVRVFNPSLLIRVFYPSFYLNLLIRVSLSLVVESTGPVHLTQAGGTMPIYPGRFPPSIRVSPAGSPCRSRAGITGRPVSAESAAARGRAGSAGPGNRRAW